MGDFVGTPGGTRTPDLDVRTVLLYPAELPGRVTYKRYHKLFGTFLHLRSESFGVYDSQARC